MNGKGLGAEGFKPGSALAIETTREHLVLFESSWPQFPHLFHGVTPCSEFGL